MRKRIIGQEAPAAPDDEQEAWMDLERLAQVEVTSEDAAHPIESALLPGSGPGWQAELPGEQTVRLVFDEPVRIRRVLLDFREEGQARTQEFVLRWSSDGGRTFRDIVRQQYTFSPGGATSELEDYEVDLQGATALELHLVPAIGGGDARASLARLRLAPAPGPQGP